MDTAATARRPGLAVFFYVFLPFALGHYLSTLLRSVNAVLAPALMQELALSPAQLGTLTSAFFLTFALAQLPVGIALDRYGPRRVQLFLMLVASLGALLFAHGRSFGELVFARALMGVGLGGCFMSAVKAVSSVIAPHKLPSVHGYLIAVGGLGAASSTLPVRLALHYTDWRGVFEVLAWIVALASILVWLAAPRAAPSQANSKPTHAQGGQLLRPLIDVYRNPQFGRTIGLVLVPHAVFFGVQGLWVGRWLSDVGGYSDETVAYLLYLGMAALIFGAISVGMITEWAARRGIAPLDVAATGVAVFILVQAAMAMNYAPSLHMLAVLFTLVGTITGIEYAIVAQSMPRTLTGRAATCLNLLIFAGAFVVQAGFGQLVGWWQPDPQQHYPAQAYSVAFGVLVALQLPGLIYFILRRRPVECPDCVVTTKEDYETGSLRPPR
jgi:MFS family permease